MALPNTKVEIAFNAGYTTAAASRTWTDVSAYVEAAQGLTINRGRADEISQIQPSTLSLTLDNTDGRFTPEKTGGAYYPNVKKGRPIRVTSTYNAVTYVRFVGYINEWPVQWPDSTSATSTVTITASSRMARLGLGATLGNVGQVEILLDAPSGYWPMSDAAEAIVASDQSGNGRAALTQAGTGTAITFGATMELGGATATGAQFAGGKYLSGYSLATAASWTTEIAFSTTFSASTQLIAVFNGVPLVTNFSTGLLAFNSANSAVVVNDGATHSVSITSDASGNYTVRLDGTSVLTGTNAALGNLSTVTIGGPDNATYPYVAFTGTMAQFAIFSSVLSSTRLSAHAAAQVSGFNGDLSGARIARYAEMAAIPTAEQSLDAGVAVIGVIDSTDQTPITLMQKVTDTENGILYDAKDSTGSLVFKDRDHRYNLASSFTLNATTQEIQGDLLPRLDDQFLVNDATATGIDTSAHIIDTTSTADYGYYRQSLDVASSDPDAMRALAEWRVGLNKQPTTRYPTVSVDVVNLSTAQAALALAADISTRFGLSSLPSQAPASTADLFIEGYAERITESKHLITFNTSPTTGYAGAAGVWQLDVNNIDGPYVLAL